MLPSHLVADFHVEVHRLMSGGVVNRAGSQCDCLVHGHSGSRLFLTLQSKCREEDSSAGVFSHPARWEIQSGRYGTADTSQVIIDESTCENLLSNAILPALNVDWIMLIAVRLLQHACYNDGAEEEVINVFGFTNLL